MVDLQGKTKRELNNRLSDLNIKMANMESDLKRLGRHKSEHELVTRKLRKEIQRKEMELDELKLVARKFEKNEFELNSGKRLLRKQIQETMAAQRTIIGE
jgi:chromosome segregation ATPase